MSVFLHQLVAVLTSLILALPPGSCCVFVHHDRADSAPENEASCCHKTAPNRPCEPKNVPAQPNLKCCCVQDAALPQKSVQPTDTHDLAFAVVAHHVPLNIGSTSGDVTDFTPIRSGPNLQILLCVWRC